MLIAIVEFTVPAADRDAALAILLSQAASIRAMSGCLAYRPFVDPQNAQACGVLHEWESEDAFINYTKSPVFASMGAALMPMMTAPPNSRRFSAELIEDVA